MKKYLFGLLAVGLFSFYSAAVPVTITRTGGKVYSTNTENPSNCTTSYKFTCGTDANATCFTLTYDDGTVAAPGSGITPLEEGKQEPPVQITLYDENGNQVVTGFLENYYEYNVVDPVEGLVRQYDFFIND